MKSVLDASVAARWVLRDLLQAKARQLRAAYQNRTYELLAPDIFIAEVAGALTKAERQKIIRVGDRCPGWTRYAGLPTRLASQLRNG